MRKIIAIMIIATLTNGIVYSVGTEINTPGGKGRTDIELTVEASKFSVTVPMTLPIKVDLDGIVYTADNVKIINNSYGQVQVKRVDIIALDGWKIVEEVSKKQGVNEINLKVSGKGLSHKEFPIISDGSIEIEYDAKISPQRADIYKEKIAEIIFTIGWYD